MITSGASDDCWITVSSAIASASASSSIAAMPRLKRRTA
jgi:hypothetical protein